MSTDTLGNEQYIKDQHADKARAEIGEVFGLGRAPVVEGAYEYIPEVHIVEPPLLHNSSPDQGISTTNEYIDEIDLTILPPEQARDAVKSIGLNLDVVRRQKVSGTDSYQELRNAA